MTVALLHANSTHRSVAMREPDFVAPGGPHAPLTELDRATDRLRQAGAVSKNLVERFVNYFRTSCWVTPLAVTEEQEPRSVFFLTGPCGSGKSTVGVNLAKKLGLPLIEGDDIHTRTARQKMHNLQPLGDADRLTWLAHIRGAVADRIASSGAPGAR